jgi:uncharacterized protein with GYD domain
MPIYFIGAKLTSAGARDNESFAQRAQEAAQIRQQHGGRLIAAYVTFGRYDLIFLTDYPNQKEALAAIEANLAKGEFTFEVEEALPLEDFLKATN